MSAMPLVTTALLAVASLVCCAAALTVLRTVSLIPYQQLRKYWTLLGSLCLLVAFVCVLPAVLQLSEYSSIANTASAVALLSAGVLLLLFSLLTGYSLRVMREVYKLDEKNIWDAELAGVYNRSYLDHRLDTEISRSHRYGAPLSIIALDISGYYKFTDKYGHHAGKIAMQNLADRLLKSLRDTDLVARYRDDTLILVLPDTPESTVHVLGERLRARLANVPVLDVGIPEVHPVTIDVNFGFAHCLLSTVNGSGLLNLAITDLRGKTEIPKEIKRKLVAKSTLSAIPEGPSLDAA